MLHLVVAYSSRPGPRTLRALGETWLICTGGCRELRAEDVVGLARLTVI